MVIGRLLAPVHSLGPGERVCLWTQGCRKNCAGCIAPELQSFQGIPVDNEKLARLIVGVGQQSRCAGLTISGGDPFEQPEDLRELLRAVRDAFEDILVYTGYTIEEIYAGRAGQAGIGCLREIDVLIDGRYEKKLNTCDCVLRGSANQVIHYLNPEKRAAYAEYMKKGRILESFVHNGQTIITGIMNEEENK